MGGRSGNNGAERRDPGEDRKGFKVQHGIIPRQGSSQSRNRKDLVQIAGQRWP